MYDWLYALVGFLIMFGVLVSIGINQPRGTSVKMWCYGYLTISIVFDALVVLALVNASQYVWLTNFLLGLSAGAATGLGIHVAHHISEEGHDENKKEEISSIFGF
jgi:hypothetical protein